MSNENNLSEGDYLDSLLKAVTDDEHDDFDIDEELEEDFGGNLDAEFDAEFETEVSESQMQDISDSVSGGESDSGNEKAEKRKRKKEKRAKKGKKKEADDEFIINELPDAGNAGFENDADSITNMLEQQLGAVKDKKKNSKKEDIKKSEAGENKKNKKSRQEKKAEKRAEKLQKDKLQEDKPVVKSERAEEDDFSFNDFDRDEERPDFADNEFSELGLDGLFGNDELPERGGLDDEMPGAERRGRFDDDEEEEEESSGKDKKGKKDKKKKDKKDKKAKKDDKKEKKEKKPKKVKEKKEKKEKAPDEIIPLSKGGLILGLSFVVLFVTAVYIGGDYYNYDQKMNQAYKYFAEDKNYKAAYREISGMKMRNNEDKNFLEQITVVMTVENNYNSFETYYELEMYREALDCLLKGVKNFDLYQNVAREWAAFDDLENALRHVVDALNEYYGITESAAREINLLESRREYSARVDELSRKVIIKDDSNN